MIDDLTRRTGCEVRRDRLTRRLYATDASIYELEPAAVAFPRATAECAAVVAAAAADGLAITPRGAGTGLAGGALGHGLVVDLARHGRWIDAPDLDRRTVRVGPGVVLDQLNADLRPHGLWFGPDVATSSRATLGGMIANNSSGAHAPIYGTTADHLAQLEVVLGDGTVAVVGPEEDDLDTLRAAVDEVIEGVAPEIARRLPPGLVKRWPGYGLDRYLRARGDLAQLVSGSEGTLALITAATLRLVPLPRERGLAVLFFATVGEALQAAVEIAALGPAAVEHIDRPVLDQTRDVASFRAARDLLGLDHEPGRALLLVEVFEDPAERLADLARRGLGRRTLICRDQRERDLVWSVRKAGLNLLTARLGPAKPAACIEDVCVRPDRLPAYVAELERVMAELDLEASYYGHAASGELHVRPVLDLHTAVGVERLRRVSDRVSELCRSFAGSLAAEHGVGMARTEYLAAHLGPELTTATAQVKELFDPAGRLNPGKIVDTGEFRIDRHLRQGPASALAPPFAEAITFGARGEDLVANLEQCNGCGGCRKDAPTMCPTFLATGEEAESTRGRANALRAAFEGRFDDPVVSIELGAALDHCLACKACRRECPSGVDLAALKAQLLAARHRLRGPSALDRLVAAADLAGRLGTLAPALSNAVLAWRPLRRALERLLGLAADRPLPTWSGQRFDHWFRRRGRATTPASGRRVLLWDDTWVRYHEPEVGRAAVAVLEAMGLEVALVEGRRCCGRPAFSRGLIERAAANGRHNLGLLRDDHRPVVFLEPSCHAMFVDEYRALGLAGADGVAARSILFEDLVLAELAARPDALALADRGRRLAVHAHCHAKALADPSSGRRLLAELPGSSVELLATGCCGMAGAFGLEAAKQELSRAVAEPLLATVAGLPAGAELVASGTSCRHQLRHLAGVEPLHVAEALARDLTGGRG